MKNSQTVEISIEKNLISSKRKPKLFETDRGKEFSNNIFRQFLNNNNIKTYSRKTYLGAVFSTDLIELLKIF